jgi:hypothetical protein
MSQAETWSGFVRADTGAFKRVGDCPHLEDEGNRLPAENRNSTQKTFRDTLDATPKAGRSNMEQILINLVAGALGGVGAGKASPTFDLGMLGNVIAGLVGGGVLGQIVTLLMPAIMAAAQSGDLSVSGIISQAIAGGAGGAILTAIVGAIKNKVAA